ncbi:MAG: DUF2786 domain-containing protein [Actinomycetota bacterium]|nr:DUF2786 domain-containing protein [Actinomycetota bacterium]
MARSSKKRRVHSQRQQARRQRGAGDDPTLDELIAFTCASAFGPAADKQLFARAMAALQQLEAEPDPLDRPSTRIQQVLAALTTSILDGGWQPADLVHTTKREWTLRASRLTTAFIAEHSRRFDAPARAPHAWLGQLVDLGVVDAERTTVIGGRGDLLAAWARAERLHPEEALAAAVQVLAQVRQLPRLPITVTPPSKWGASNRGVEPTPRSTEGVDAKALKLIRALLAKAEATTFEAEADAFTAKAQEMMTRHSIDAAVLASANAGSRTAAGVESHRVHIDNPYAEEKAGFLSAIAGVNGVRSIWVPYAGMATLMGFPVDLQLTDLLFTSLLVQATRASAAATAADRRLSTPSFRRAFIIAFAHRIAERLEAARDHVAAEAAVEYGDSLLPVLASREAAVEAAYEAAFPNAITTRGRSLNAAGWYAGRAAADAADIGAGAAITSG